MASEAERSAPLTSWTLEGVLGFARDRLTYLRGNILVLTITQTLGMLVRSMAFPYASLYVLALGGSSEQIGLIAALSPLAGFLVYPVGGYLADHVGRVKLIALGGYLSSAVLMLFVLAPNWWMLALATLLRGFIVFQFPPTSAIIADSLAPTDRAKGIGTMSTISGAVALVAPYLAGHVLAHFGDETGMRVLYGAMTVIYLASAVINHRFLHETTAMPRTSMRLSELPEAFLAAYRGISELLRSLPSSVKALTLIVTLGFFSNAVASPYWVVYARDHIGLSTKSWGLVLLVETIARTLLSIPAGVAIDRNGRTRFVRLALIIAGVAMSAYMVAAGFVQVLIIRAVIGIANAFFLAACTAMMANGLPRDIRGRAMAALGRGAIPLAPSSGGTGGPGMGYLLVVPVVLGSLLGGFLYGAGPELAWLVSLGALVGALVVSFTWLHDVERAEV